MKLQSGGNDFRLPREEVKRAIVARNCSGRSDVGGGLNRFFFASASLGSWFVLSASEEEFEGGRSFGGGSERKGVRVSEVGMRGKEAVEKT